MDIEDELKVVGQNQQTLEVRIVIVLFESEIIWSYDHTYMVTIDGNIAMNGYKWDGGRISKLLR